MPLSASLTPCADSRHCSYSSLNRAAAWLSVQPSRTDVLMVLERAACRPVASAASERHCPAMDCRVAMSIFTSPPPIRVPPGRRNGKGPVSQDRAVRPQRAPLSTEGVQLPRNGTGAGQDPAVIDAPPPAGPRPRASRCWTLCSADGAVDVQVVAADDDRLGAVLPGVAAALGVAVPGLW